MRVARSAATTVLHWGFVVLRLRRRTAATSSRSPTAPPRHRSPGWWLIAILAPAGLLASCQSRPAPSAPLPNVHLESVQPHRAPTDADTVIELHGSGFVEAIDAPGTNPLRVFACHTELQDAHVQGVEQLWTSDAGRTLRLRVGDTITATIPAGTVPSARTGVGVRTFLLRDSWLLDALECYDPRPEIAAFTIQPTSPTAGSEVTFSWTSTSPDGRSMACRLEPGGTETPVVLDPCNGPTTHTVTYSTAGDATAILTVTDDTGRERSERLTLTVLSAGAAR